MSPHDINLLLFRFRDFIHKNLFQIKTRHFHILDKRKKEIILKLK